MSVNIFDPKLKRRPLAGLIFFKKVAPGKWVIMIQRRFVNPKYRATYDSINHLRFEVVLGLLHPGEDVITCLLRESQEECGMPPGWKPLRILGVRDEDLQNDNRQILALTSMEDYLRAEEIFGLPVGPDLEESSSGRGDCTVCWKPDRLPLVGEQYYESPYVIWNLGEPQPWVGPIFMGEVKPGWEPNYDDADGEAGPHMWCPPHQLLEMLHGAPDMFMGPLVPVLKRACEDILAGKIK